MFLKYGLRVVSLALVALITFACSPEDLDVRVIKSPDDAGASQSMTCVLVDWVLVADLPVSDATAKNAYEDLSFIEWCESNIMRGGLSDFVGNAAAWEADEDDPLILATSPAERATRPTLAQGARLKLHVLEPRGTIPFIRKIHFADWEGPNGRCALEMRVYQENIGETGKKPLLYFHGGGWSERTTTMTAAEVLVTQFVDEHVVFMPAYPLHGDKDGPEECRGADFEDILDAAQQAFDWVSAHKNVFGATGAETMDVMGHSAGGQLSAYVATRNRAQVDKFVNFYGPMEFAQFVDESDPGGLYADRFEGSKETLASLLGVDDLASLERPYPDVVNRNSVSEIIAASGAGAVPPFFVVQGNADTTVPVEQALPACNALGGNATAAGGEYDCGNDSHVTIVADAGHNLDRLCISGEWPATASETAREAMDAICPTVAADSNAIRIAVQAAFEWLDQ